MDLDTAKSLPLWSAITHSTFGAGEWGGPDDDNDGWCLIHIPVSPGNGGSAIGHWVPIDQVEVH